MSHVLTAAALVVVLGAIAIVVWDSRTCAEWGPSRTVIMMQSCGENCWFFVPVENRECLRRKP
jgi:hypothetical protein